jgi:hypothetical protein
MLTLYRSLADDVRQTLLDDVHLGPDRDFLQRHRHPHLASQVWIVEPVRPSNALVRDQLEVLAAERVVYR